MKALLFSLLLLLAASAVAQSQAASTSNAAAQKVSISSAQSDVINQSQQNLCYTMRVYAFERNDGSSSLAGSGTCTPAENFRAIYIPTVVQHPEVSRVRHCSASGCTTVSDSADSPAPPNVPAQNQPVESPQPRLQRPGETSFGVLGRVPVTDVETLKRKLQAFVETLRDAPPARTCAYIHSFIFERQDGEAPKLAKETYCTPTGAFAVHHAAKPGLYPAVMGSKESDSKSASKDR